MKFIEKILNLFKKPLLCVIMHRWCDIDEHSYMLGVWNNFDECMINGKKEIRNRGNKYGFAIYEICRNGYRGKKLSNMISETD